MTDAPFRSGMVGLVGRPNTGKSTLLNALCGEKVSIVSEKPQTTRNRIMGVKHLPEAQLVFVDTPGLQAVERAINRYMRGVVGEVVSDVDVLVYLVDATREAGREEEMALAALHQAGRDTPVVLAVNKVDAAGADKAGARLSEVSALLPFKSSFVVSALKGEGLDKLVRELSSLLPWGPPYFPPEMVTDQPLGFRLAEMVREALFSLTHQEIPYSLAVVTEDVSRRADGAKSGLTEVSATIYVEKDSQKAIVIGKGGAMLKKVGEKARRAMEQRLGSKVFLRLWVKVKEGWTSREDLLRQLGYR
jgi:GTP-binding protein Era